MSPMAILRNVLDLEYDISTSRDESNNIIIFSSNFVKMIYNAMDAFVGCQISRRNDGLEDALSEILCKHIWIIFRFWHGFVDWKD